ncbi:hypothetical protein GJU41_12705 [Bacillus idriensis]|uniref:Uncharacterized protein n=1 Tax=Metabacillus idriensis TaxID=324768 RepID=A0A6I2M921_9BACI|nr:hypothetical protein [Metabacillus idriensis]MRX54835.1 hypothetical protein [Metabacillus idriensis]
MTFEQFKSRYKLKLAEIGLTTNDEEMAKMFVAATVLRDYDLKQMKKDRRKKHH